MLRVTVDETGVEFNAYTKEDFVQAFEAWKSDVVAFTEDTFSVNRLTEDTVEEYAQVCADKLVQLIEENDGQ